MSVSDILDRIRAKMAAVDPTAPRKCSGRVLIQLSGDQLWTMDLDALTLTAGAAADGVQANATFAMDDETFVELGNRQLDIAEAKASGRVLVEGDAELLAALRECSTLD